MEGLRIQSVVRPEKPLSFNERTELIFNEVLRSKGLTNKNNDNEFKRITKTVKH